MVEVLHRGQGAKQTLCDNCESLLRYSRNEVFTQERNHDYLGDFDTVAVIRCPHCGQTTTL